MSVDPQYWQTNNDEWRGNPIAIIAAGDGATATEMVKASMIKMDMPKTFDLLYSDDIWICDSGVLSHSSKSKRGPRM